MNGIEITSLITALANFVSCNTVDDDTLGLLGAIFTQLGDTITTISVQRSLCNKSNDKNTDITHENS